MKHIICLVSLFIVCHTHVYYTKIASQTLILITISPPSEAWFGWLTCRWYECCQEPWLKNDLQGLEVFFNKYVYGQTMATDIIMRSLRNHVNNKTPRKALVLSMHGYTGSGRTYTSNAIAQYLYQEGVLSHFVHLLPATLLYAHENMVKKYQDDIKNLIQAKTLLCDRNLFIFDEFDRMPPGVMDAIKPFLDYHKHIDGVDYRKNIFIFQGNIGSHAIYNYTLSHHRAGKQREDIKLKEIEPIISKAAYTMKGGLMESQLIDHNLVNAFIPFLPMERQHILKCVEDYLLEMKYGIDRELVKQVADELDYMPHDLKLYSTTGCKRISSKVHLVMQLQRDEL